MVTSVRRRDRFERLRGEGRATADERLFVRFAAEHDSQNLTHQLPSGSSALKMEPGVTGFEFTGTYGVDWAIYSLSTAPQEAVIGNWSVRPWGNFITDRLESQHILRVRGTGAFTTVVLPWRRGEKPPGLTVRRDGEAVIVTSASATARIEETGYSVTAAQGTVNRTFDSRAGTIAR